MWTGNLSAILLAAGLVYGLDLPWLTGWLTAVNLVAFVLFGVDKQFAKRSRRRISEADLLYYLLIGGTLGATIGMKLFRHKTQKKSFRRWYWSIVAVQLILLMTWLWWKLS